MIWTWKIMICHSYISVPDCLTKHVKNFRIEERICVAMANLFYKYLDRTGLDKLFRIRMSQCISLQEDFERIDEAILQSTDALQVQVLEKEKKDLRIQMLGFG
jgi:hypothetical protein